MNCRLTIRLPQKTVEKLKQASMELKVSRSELVRQLLEGRELAPSSHALNSTASAPTTPPSKPDPLIYENNLLLRKIARHMNSQIVREVDEKIKQLEEYS